MELTRDSDKIVKYFKSKGKKACPHNSYGYSIYNLDENKIIARVYKLFEKTEWVKLDADTGDVLEYYREFYFETANGIISIAYDCDTWEPIEYYRDSVRRGLRERVKFDFYSNEEIICDIFGCKEQLKPFMPNDVYEKVKALPFEIMYYSNKPYGHIVGFFEI